MLLLYRQINKILTVQNKINMIIHLFRHIKNNFSNFLLIKFKLKEIKLKNNCCKNE